MRGVNRPEYRWIFLGLPGRISGKLPEHLENGAARRTGFFECALDGSNAFAAVRSKHVLLGREVVEECSFSHVGCFSDVFYRGFQESALSKKFECGTIKPLSRFKTATFTSIRARMYCGHVTSTPDSGLRTRFDHGECVYI